MRKYLIVSILALTLTTVILYAQTSGNPSQIRVNVDANGYLVTAYAAQTSPITTVQFNQARLAVDSSGNLLVTGSGSSTVAQTITTSTNPSLRSGTGIAYGQPTGTPSFVDSGVAGNLNGAYRYCYTETDGVGETICSAVSGSVSVTNKKTTVTIPQARRGTILRKLYRTVASGSVYKLVTSTTGGTDYFQTTYTDNTADGSLGANAPSSDTTASYNLEINQGVKNVKTSPAQGTAAGDLTILTTDGGNTAGYAIDAYGTVTARSYAAGNALYSLYTQAADGTFAGANYVAQYLSNIVGDTATTVFKINPKGTFVLSPLTLSDAAAADGATTALSGSATFPAVSTVENIAYAFNSTGAGSSAFDQIGIKSAFLAGYTGSKNTYAMYGQNATANGNAFGGLLKATAAAAFSIGSSSSGTGGIKNIGVYGTSSGTDPSTLTFGSGVTGIAGAFSNGSNSDDIIVGFDNTTAVFRIKNDGDASFSSPSGDASLVWDWTATSGGGNFSLTMTGGTSVTLKSTNNIPMILGTNNTTRLTVGTDSSFLFAAVAFGSLPGSPTNGMMLYCNDCTIANPCAGAGNGAFAKRLNGVWVCN